MTNIFYRVLVLGENDNTVATTGYYKTSRQAVAVCKASYPNNKFVVRKEYLHYTEIAELAAV